MYVQRKESVLVCFVRDKEADGKRHIDGRAQGAKLLGDPVAVQSPPAVVQATGIRLSPTSFCCLIVSGLQTQLNVLFNIANRLD